MDLWALCPIFLIYFKKQIVLKKFHKIQNYCYLFISKLVNILLIVNTFLKIFICVQSNMHFLYYKTTLKFILNLTNIESSY